MMVRIWHMYMALAIAAIICLAIHSCNGAPVPQSLQGKEIYSREKRGIFGQLTSVTSTTTATAAPRFKFGTTPKRHNAPKKTSTTTTESLPSTSVSPKSTSEINEVSTVSSIPEMTTVHKKQTTEEMERISWSALSTSSLSPIYMDSSPSALTLSSSSLSPIYMNSSPSALMLHQSSEEPISFPNYDDHEQVVAVRHSFPPKKENLHKAKEEKDEESANNRALSPSSIWNLIVVLLQLAYTVTQQKIPP